MPHDLPSPCRPLLPRAVTGLRVDHSPVAGPGQPRLRLVVDFTPGHPDAEEELTVALPRPSDPASAEAADRMRDAFLHEWGYAQAAEAHGPVEWPPGYRTHAVLREVEWREQGTAARKARDLFDVVADLVLREAYRALTEDRPPRPVGRHLLPPPPAIPRPLRDVEARYHKRGGCGGTFALAWVDVEPLPAGGADFAFVDARPAVGGRTRDRAEPVFVAAFAQGLREALEQHGGGRPPYAARVLLRDAVRHITDSSEGSFRIAGLLAAREIMACIAEDREPRPRWRPPRR